MSQHQKLICGGLFVFFAATHVGCAGGGLKNMFTRNETDGYHSLDELEAEESGSSEKTPTVAARLASWRPFGTVDPAAEESYAASEAHATKADATADATSTARSLRLPGLAFSKRDEIAPDPFLGAEPQPAGRSESPAANSAADQKIAKTDDKHTKTDLNSVSRKDADAVALDASRKSDSGRSKSEDEDNSLEKRFEQHFLQSAVVKSGADMPATTNVGSKKRDLADIADRQIDQFNYLLTADPDPNVKNPEFQRNSDSTELKVSRRKNAATEESANSLFAFDQLIGQEVSDGSHKATQVAHTTIQKTAALDINVADAEALFGAAAARQNSRTKHAEDSVRSESSGHTLTRSSAWSQTPAGSEGFRWNNSSPEKTVVPADNSADDASNAFARYAQSNSGKNNSRSTVFGAPPVCAGNIESDDCSVLETAAIRLSNASASATDHRIITADYGTVHPKVVIHPAPAELSGAGDARFTTAPVAPAPDLESSVDAASQAMRPGLVQSFSTRNWLLLIGGIIVIALLFAPGRTKPVTMNS